jgi:hypothetical protein
MAKDITLKYKYINNSEMECGDKNATLHPQTCLSQVLVHHNSSEDYNLHNWITSFKELELKETLLDWLNTYYPHPNDTYNLPIATNSTLGGVVIGEGLSIDENGLLSVTNISNNNYEFNLDQFSIINNTLHINPATYYNLGAVRLSFESIIDSYKFYSANTTSTSDQYIFRVGRTQENQMAVVVPRNLFDSGNNSNVPNKSTYIITCKSTGNDYDTLTVTDGICDLNQPPILNIKKKEEVEIIVISHNTWNGFNGFKLPAHCFTSQIDIFKNDDNDESYFNRDTTTSPGEVIICHNDKAFGIYDVDKIETNLIYKVRILGIDEKKRLIQYEVYPHEYSFYDEV